MIGQRTRGDRGAHSEEDEDDGQSDGEADAGAPQLPRGLLVDSLWNGWFDVARQLDCAAIVCNHALWNEATVAQVHGAGMRCLSYTVNDEWVAARLVALGTDGIVTDRVDLFSPAD